MPDEPRVTDSPEASRFEIVVDGDVAGFAEYQRDGEVLSLTHTVVDPRFEGQGIGSRLAQGAVASAREQGLSVLPRCSFVRDWLERHPDEIDVVPADQRAGFRLDQGATGAG